MPAPLNTLLIDGSFEELSEELAQYIDDVKRKQGDDQPNTRNEITRCLEQDEQDDALKVLVSSSIALNAAPEKEFVAAYNLLVHLIRQSPNPEVFLPRICQNLSQPISSSPHNGPGLALCVLTTIFNILQQDHDSRFNIFIAILNVIRKTSSYDALKPQLKNLESWMVLWDVENEDQRKLWLRIAEVAAESGDLEQAYLFLLRALRTIPSEDSGSQDARELSLRALKSALSDPSHFDFQDLTALDSIQALRKSDPVFFELLEIFGAEQLDEYDDFVEEHGDWIQQSGLDRSVLHRKMKLLTLASLAASSQSRSLPYQRISRALQVQPEDVEMWVIDVIRAGLVEGKLSQLNQTFLIHRSTYRVFGDKQWKEVASRLETWRHSLEGVLEVIRQERERAIREKERELREVETKLNGVGVFGTSGGGRPARKLEHATE